MAIAATTPKNAPDKVTIATSMTVKWQTFNQDKSQQSVQLATIARDAEYSKTFYSIDISPDGRLIAAGSRNGYIYIWDTSRLSPTKNNVERMFRREPTAPCQNRRSLTRQRLSTRISKPSHNSNICKMETSCR